MFGLSIRSASVSDTKPIKLYGTQVYFARDWDQILYKQTNHIIKHNDNKQTVAGRLRYNERTMSSVVLLEESVEHRLPETYFL